MNEIINRKRGLTPDSALRLEAAFGASAQFWLNAQLASDLYARRCSRRRPREIRKRIRRIPFPA